MNGHIEDIKVGHTIWAIPNENVITNQVLVKCDVVKKTVVEAIDPYCPDAVQQTIKLGCTFEDKFTNKTRNVTFTISDEEFRHHCDEYHASTDNGMIFTDVTIAKNDARKFVAETAKEWQQQIEALKEKMVYLQHAGQIIDEL